MRKEAERLTSATPRWLERVLAWGSAHSMWPLILGLSEDALEWLAALTPRYDLARFGSEVFRSSPRQADLLVVNGPITFKFAPRLIKLYHQMASPKFVIAYGSGAISGGIHADSYSVVPGVDRLIPVDIYVPGSPPRPEALLDALVELARRVKQEASRR